MVVDVCAQLGEDVALSLEALIAMTGRSRSTWWRRLEEGEVAKLPSPARGRALVRLRDVLGALPCAGRWALGDVLRLARADAGDALAQVDVGVWLALWALAQAGGREGALAQGAQVLGGRAGDGVLVWRAAVYWLELAAQQGQAEAMHWLALLHGSGLPLAQGPAAVLGWLARAAGAGHVLARSQLQGLLGRAGLVG